jgi:hypothetical protein
VLVLHVLAETLRRLAGVADRPHATVELARDVFDKRLVAVDLDVFAEFLLEPELPGEEIENLLIRFQLKDRLDDLLTPLQRSVRRRARPVGLELPSSGQEIDVVGATVHDRRDRRVRIDDDEKVELLHRSLHFWAARLRIGRSRLHPASASRTREKPRGVEGGGAVPLHPVR